jgi:2'-5' RNA ligase
LTRPGSQKFAEPHQRLEYRKTLTVVLARLDVWRKSNALVLTPEDAPPELMRLSYELKQAMLSFGRDQERKVIRPHLTLTFDYHSQLPEVDSQPKFFIRADRFALYEYHKGNAES